MPGIKIFIVCTLIFLSTEVVVVAQTSKPIISYKLKVDAADLSGYDIEIHIQHAPHSFKLAMATHHEYDDRFWRYIENFTVETGTGAGSFTREDSAVWRINIPGDNAVIKYRIHLPSNYPYHPSHRPFLVAYGGLVGDIHSFMYIVGYTHLPARISFLLPAGWQIATGLAPTNDEHTYTAPNAKTLLDCPVFIGLLRSWPFTTNGVIHRVVYLQLPNAPAFDTIQLVNNIKKIVQQTVSLFGSFPYHDYTFLLKDGAYGALEHGNSVTIGAPAEMLANNMKELYEELAHEFSHTWNLVTIKPAEYTDLNYGAQQQSAGLWFSEGFTMLYADLLVRRAGLPAEDSTRIAHLEALTARYYSDTGNSFIPPGKVSLASNAQPGMLGDYEASTHLQGELIGAMLDFIIRDATNGNRSLDAVMRTMFKRFCGDKGFYAKDIEQAVHDVCSCEVHGFFKNYVYDGKAIDFNQCLELIGLKLNYSSTPAKDEKAQLIADTRIYIYQPPGDTLFKLALQTPNSCWGRAGLHAGDILISVNNQPIKTRQDFNDLVGKTHIGDTVIVDIKRNGNMKKIIVEISGYNRVVTHITPVENSTEKERRSLEKWESGE